MSETQIFLIRIPAILIALTVHEYAHGYIAWVKGDSTAKNSGRLTFNPFAHIDPIGALMLLWGPFGWAKPVPVNPINLDNPKRDMIFVSAAGPVSNIILALIFGYSLRLLKLAGAYSFLSSGLIIFIHLCVIINIGISFFNLIPIPPLDGSNILMGFLPHEKIDPYLRAVRYAPQILLGMIVSEWLFHIPLFSSIINPLWIPYFTFWQFIIFGGKVM